MQLNVHDTNMPCHTGGQGEREQVILISHNIVKPKTKIQSLVLIKMDLSFWYYHL